ncbi:Transcriptional regulator, LacI family [Parafrankia sp. Ea1.12]|nr:MULTISPECIES: LacI family DNA-binding transcriptional regulator [unclassified Parafrankia]SQD96793.1 Transcriptional regulator, LacI family [Parafrankia sp. Ea1.12]
MDGADRGGEPAPQVVPGASEPGGQGEQGGQGELAGPGEVGEVGSTMPASGRPPALTDVARLVGVSHQTVSRVVNNHPGVRPRTRERVLAGLRELGYRPNPAARALATGRSRTLGVLALTGTLYGPTSTLYAVEQAARAADYQVTVVSLHSLDPGAVRQALGRLLAGGIDGVVAIAPLLDATDALSAVATRLPLVAVEGRPDGNIATVSVDQEHGARTATEHLLAAGHPTVRHVAGPSDWYEGAGRIAGWRAALEAAGAAVHPPLAGDWTARAGFAAGRQLAREPDLTAVFVANDQMALGVLRALREGGRRVPEDVSVVGFDDIPEAAYFSPPLTTLRQDFTEVGRQSLRSLLEQVETGATGRAHVVIPPELVLRRSTAPPP